MLNTFTILVDSREQLPFGFSGLTTDHRHGYAPLTVPLRVATLKQGDYSIEGMADLVACERKSCHDLYNTLGQHRARFIRELERLATLTIAAVMVEAEWSEILTAPPAFSKLNPKTIFRSVQAWIHRYPTVHWQFLPGRRLAEQATFRFLERFWIERQRELERARTLALAQQPALRPAPPQ